VIIVDDRLALDALAGRSGPGPVATTWGFHYRLLRALADPAGWGTLSRTVIDEARRLAADPPASRLLVLDPRESTNRAAELSVRHGLNLLAAELVAAAAHHRASVRLHAANVGRRWPDVLEAESIAYHVM
jgi:hypothetical protein